MIGKPFFFFLLALVLGACNNDDDTPDLVAVESETATNIPAPQTGGPPSEDPAGGPFTKFSFETGSVTTSDTEWDIAFRGTRIAVNGGVETGSNDEPVRNGNAAAAIVTGTFASITDASNYTFAEDSATGFAIPAGSDNGWYNYNPQVNVVTPIPGTVLVIRTHNGRFAKVEVLSYYKDAPAQPDGFVDEFRFYTFNYVYNPNEGETTLE